jgi:hypothetical protein
MIIVTGCGRSGTSAVAGMLHRSGIAVGHDLIPADDNNADGYFEERAVVQANDAIISATPLVDRFANPAREEILAAAAPHAGAMRGLVEYATPAWKDPRFCWTLEAWLPALCHAPRVIICLRSPAEVVASTMRYYGMTTDDDARSVVHTWRTENERLAEIVESHALVTTVVEFDRLIGQTDAVARELSGFVGKPIVAGVRGELRHHRAGIDDELRAVYERVLALGT